MLASVKTMASAYLGITTLIRGFTDLVKVSGDFDSAQAKLASVTGSTREEISDLTGVVLSGTAVVTCFVTHGLPSFLQPGAGRKLPSTGKRRVSTNNPIGS